MKKIIIAGFAIAAAVAANAAAIDWSANAVCDPVATAAAGKATPASGWLGYVVLAADLGTVTTDLDAGNTESLASKAVGPVKATSSKGKFADSTPSGNVAAGTQDFYLIVLNAASAASATSYVVSDKLTATVDASLDTSLGFGSMQAKTSSAANWTSMNAPEPTSGILLLLGMAGLALKRKRA